MKLSQVPMEKMMEALPKLATNFQAESMVFNLNTEIEAGRVKRPDWYMAFNADGTIACGEGHKEAEGAIIFTLKQGGLNTMIGFMLDGLNGGPRSAMMSMMMGKIGIEPFNPKNVKATESFFKRVKTGEDVVKAALAEVGVAVDDIDI